MPTIAISYRRADSEAITGRIFDRLDRRYGRESVFRDIDSVPLGIDFREHVAAVFDRTDIVLVIIGPRWAGRRGGQSRLDDPADLVRIEVETALRKGIPVIPILVGRAGLPKVEQLPDSLKNIAYRNGLRVDSGQDFDAHVDRLLRAMDRILAAAANISTVGPPPAPAVDDQKDTASPEVTEALSAAGTVTVEEPPRQSEEDKPSPDLTSPPPIEQAQAPIEQAQAPIEQAQAPIEQAQAPTDSKPRRTAIFRAALVSAGVALTLAVVGVVVSPMLSTTHQPPSSERPPPNPPVVVPQSPAPIAPTATKPTVPATPPGPPPGTQADFVSSVGDRVFFDSGRSDLTPQATDRIKQQARWLEDHPAITVMIEGDSDSVEAGSREGALALGERRAQTIKNAFVRLGVSPARISTISYGMERPAAPGTNAAALAQNRRGVITIIEGARSGSK
jgi:outer membrane protein OmpA-like peptidoglycan-associated protein